MSIFELTMLICFGVSWPISIIKSLKTKNTSGKSLLFMVLILIGYMAGIIHKILYSFDFVIYAYIFNFIMVSIDFALCLINRKTEKKKVNLKDAA